MIELRRKSTWSQQTLAVERQLSGVRETGFFSLEKKAMLMLSAKTALAAGLCYWLATLFHLQDGYWGSISAIIVLQSNVGSTVTASRDRLLGTLIGAAFGTAFSFIDAGRWVIAAYLLAVIASMVTCSLLGLKNSSRLAGVTVTIILLVHRSDSNWKLPMHRVLEVLLGIVVALAFSTLVFPSRARNRLRDGLAQEFLLLSGLLEAHMATVKGAAAASLPHIEKDAASALSANALLLDAARNEPSSGPASTEALSLVHHFGMQLHSAIQALALAIGGDRNGHQIAEKSYAAMLDPELGKLAADIRDVFQFVAACIHRWDFQQPAAGIALEGDIHALETKMSAIRPSGLEFPPEEILRAYAIQLHLKQIARMLVSSLEETSQAAR